MNNTAILRTENVSKSYEKAGHRINVLNNVSIEIDHSEVIAIVGASGVGKTTLMHILGGLDQPTTGNVFYNDSDITQLDDSERAAFRNKHIGFVFQFHYLINEFTALENVMLPLVISGKSRAQCKKDAMELLVEMGLEKRTHHKPMELSGGEQQRVAIARALINSPKVLLADEPTGNLDPDTGEHVFSTMLTLNKNVNVPLILVTHNMTLAKRSDRTLSIKNGEVSSQ